jgi:hypothetical protein
MSSVSTVTRIRIVNFYPTHTITNRGKTIRIVQIPVFSMQILIFLYLGLSAFRDRGIPKPTSECAACPSPDGSSAWASAKGGEARWPESSVREV